MQYKFLNDAAQNPEVETRHQSMLASPDYGASSRIEVWYAKMPDFVDHGIFVPNETHAKLGDVAYRRDWQSLYGPLQGDFWSPNGEANSLIRSLGLHHTSMSVGDVLVVQSPNGVAETWLCASTGWRQID